MQRLLGRDYIECALTVRKSTAIELAASLSAFLNVLPFLLFDLTGDAYNTNRHPLNPVLLTQLLSNKLFAHS